MNTIYYIIASIASTLNWLLKDRKVFGETYKHLQEKYHARNNLHRYFISNIPANVTIDYFFYQFGLRSDLPIVDVLYLEYIHMLLNEKKIKNLIILPTIDDTSKKQDEEEMFLFEENVNKILNGHKHCVTYVNPFNGEYFNSQDFVSSSFLNSLSYLGSNSFFAYLKKEFNISIRSIDDFNKYHDKEKKVLTLYTHIYKCWHVINYLKNNNLLENRANVSALLWEREVDKVGILRQISLKNKEITFYPILGKTLYTNKKNPIPVFNNGQAINVFDDLNITIEKVINIKESQIKVYNDLLCAILRDNYKLEIKNSIQEGAKIYTSLNYSYDFSTKNNIGNECKKFIYLISSLAEYYRIE